MGGGPDRQEGGRRAPLSRHQLCRSARGQRAQMHQVRRDVKQKLVVLGDRDHKIKDPHFLSRKIFYRFKIP